MCCSIFRSINWYSQFFNAHPTFNFFMPKKKVYKKGKGEVHPGIFFRCKFTVFTIKVVQDKYRVTHSLSLLLFVIILILFIHLLPLLSILFDALRHTEKNIEKIMSVRRNRIRKFKRHGSTCKLELCCAFVGCEMETLLLKNFIF